MVQANTQLISDMLRKRFLLYRTTIMGLWCALAGVSYGDDGPDRLSSSSNFNLPRTFCGLACGVAQQPAVKIARGQRLPSPFMQQTVRTSLAPVALTSMAECVLWLCTPARCYPTYSVVFSSSRAIARLYHKSFFSSRGRQAVVGEESVKKV
jgi:hypothetical protein